MMGRVEVNNGLTTNSLVEANNHHVQDARKKVINGATRGGEGQGCSEQDESKMNKNVEDLNYVRLEASQNVQEHVPPVQQRPPPQPHIPQVCWERFLPVRSLKVLIAENDDSTRHVVTALLQNCGYEVIAVSNGLQAWRILENLNNHVDLVLTEVVMPLLSGIGLLSKIMSHKTCKSIPVIMMSSYDSMNIVFKCLSKGAADYLVKPIRKNELKILWQHVWRKCHSSSGSGSESGIRTQRSRKSRSIQESDNNTVSNNEDDIGSTGLNRDGSDNGSGTQSSWTKRAVEVDSPQQMSPWNQFAHQTDSTCVQVIHSKPEALGSNWVAETGTNECEGQGSLHGKGSEIRAGRTSNLQLQEASKKVPTKAAVDNNDKLFGMNYKKDDEQQEKKQLELNMEKSSSDLRNKSSLPVCFTTDTSYQQKDGEAIDIPRALSKVSDLKDKAIKDTVDVPSLELTLRRPRDGKDIQAGFHDWKIFQHSDLSAFSRYNSRSTANQAPTGNVGSCLPVDNSLDAAKRKSIQNRESISNNTPPNLGSNGSRSSNNNDTGSTTNNAPNNPAAFGEKPASKSAFKCLQPLSALQPVQNDHGSFFQPIQCQTGARVANPFVCQASGISQHMEEVHHYHCCDHHHNICNMVHQQNLTNHDDRSLNDRMSSAPECGSSNAPGAQVDGSSSNHSLHGSGSGSNHGSNGQTGCSVALNNNKWKKTESDNEVGGRAGANGEAGSADWHGMGLSHLSLREAALNKFRLKRKERCFEKKVRYQSRKKLAEQRPRVRGQFVRKGEQESKDKPTLSS